MWADLSLRKTKQIFALFKYAQKGRQLFSGARRIVFIIKARPRAYAYARGRIRRFSETHEGKPQTEAVYHYIVISAELPLPCHFDRTKWAE